ncbi:MAG: DUF58 domain-containing protein [Glaciecola sp.]
MSALPIHTTLNKLNANGVSLSLAELIRYKGLARQLNLRPASAVRSSMAGALSSKFKGRGMEFDEARHYQPGDDIRSIDWRVTARTGHTHTKVYREERERPVLVYIDLQASMHFGTQLLYKSVQSAHAAALVMFSALSRQDKIGCVVVDDTSDIERKPKSTAKHVLGMLNQVVEMHNNFNISDLKTSQQHNNKSEDGITKLATLAKPGTLVYVISDFSQFSQRCFDALGKLQRHCEIKPLHVFDPIEHALPRVSGLQNVTLSNGFQDHSVTLGDNALAQQYRDNREVWQNGLHLRFAQMGIQLRNISAASPIEEQLVGTSGGLLLGEAP